MANLSHAGGLTRKEDNMENLKDNSVRITGATVACWPNGQEESLDMTDIRVKFDGAFCTNNSTLCYVIDREVFVTPVTRSAMAAIKEAGLTRRNFYVPFSNGDWPKAEAARWRQLQEDAEYSHRREYEADLAAWCDEHHIGGELDPGVLEQCFRMPVTGVAVRQPHYETRYYPVCNGYSIDATTVANVGNFCANNGRVVFVYRDSNTYVASGYWILKALREAGYKEAGLFVPFSNGEEIIDPLLASEWERISHKNK